MRILYINPSAVPPATDRRLDRFALLSEHLEGDVLQPVWFASHAEAGEALGAMTDPYYRSGRFRYHFYLALHPDNWNSKYGMYRFFLRRALSLHKEQPFDCIVVYAHQTTGLLGVLLRLLTGAKLIVEVVTAPELVCITERPTVTLRDRARKLYSDICLHISLTGSTRVHLLFKEQLWAYPLLRRRPASVFHDFVPISFIRRRPMSERDPFVLLVGAPWYLKGVDLLIEAFLRIAPEFPAIQLKIQGHFPDRGELLALTQGSDRIEVLKAQPLPETLDRMSRAMLFALPSRCEGLPRVLIEAMGAGVPVIGSDVGGIPSLVENEVTGFVIPRGRADVLADRLRSLLSDAGLRERIGDAGHSKVHETLGEAVYVSAFTDMIVAAVKGSAVEHSTR